MESAIPCTCTPMSNVHSPIGTNSRRPCPVRSGPTPSPCAQARSHARGGAARAVPHIRQVGGECARHQRPVNPAWQTFRCPSVSPGGEPWLEQDTDEPKGQPAIDLEIGGELGHETGRRDRFLRLAIPLDTRLARATGSRQRGFLISPIPRESEATGDRGRQEIPDLLRTQRKVEVRFSDVRDHSRLSAGVFQPRVLRERLIRAAATAARSSAVCLLRSVPLGKYCLNKPLVFSFVPCCHGSVGRRSQTASPVSIRSCA